MKKLSKRSKFVILIFIILIGIIWFCIYQNNSIVITQSDYINAKIPNCFDDFKIAHISDLHNKRFGKSQSKIIKKVESIHPDIIVITGDLIDRRKYNLDIAMEFISGIVPIAPVYYVTGNHESWSGKYLEIKESLTSAGVHVIDNSALELSKGSDSINLLGLSDPDFLTTDYLDGTNTTGITSQLEQWSSNEDFKILLSHRPELFNLYCDNNIDLVFTGHAHGGQFRLPFVNGGLVAPDQGLFPKYTSNSYHQNNTTMYVSRGLGNSIIPIRIFNRPEIISVTLKVK